jgi:hypothetical protein
MPSALVTTTTKGLRKGWLTAPVWLSPLTLEMAVAGSVPLP